MNRPYVFAGLALLALAGVLAAYGLLGSVTLKTGSLSKDPGMAECYTSGTSGELVTDTAAGTAIIEAQSGRRIVVTWPPGWTGRSSAGGVEVVNAQGQVKARTGEFVRLMGGYWTDGTFLTCGPVTE